MKIAALEEAIRRTGDALDQNSEVFRDSLQWAEAHINVQYRILNDQLKGRVRTITESGEMRLDMVSYLEEYYVCMIFVDFAAGLAKLAEGRPGLTLAEEMPDTIVFGGSS